ncbi:glycoside hydrolase family 2 protein [Agreia sp. Leaf283]|uniref:glycoside hydrolase family 2 protein n=1 Tax=Agreia sp. Leaf283 TaxID=1736321 RepID=UPI0006F8EAB4|nr:glycoside hydrolase family 2 [Agreia sp. Leaf283]KQP57518.1 glycoside hydrolase [Agreia sp. Leaf283]
MSSDAPSHTAHDRPAGDNDGSYPRPQLVRARWSELDGPWRFSFDDTDSGLDAGWQNSADFDLTITVPYPFESALSGIGDTGFHRVVWYARSVSADELSEAGFGGVDSGSDDARRLMLHFGAVDYRAMVWLNGVFLGSHEGGQTPFSFDITSALDDERAEQLLVVRAEDDPADVAQPRGKQDWRLDPHSIWYHRTTGIWQPVWLEATPTVAVRLVHWVPDVPGGTVAVRIDLARDPKPGTVVDIALSFEGRVVGELTLPAATTSIHGVVEVLEQRNGQAYEELLWSPEHPRLIDATVTVRHGEATIDSVASYLGLRSAAWGGGRFLLNNRPYFVRSVLNQGYWPESHLASPGPDAFRADIELTKELGFNATRLHQKIEDPRFLYWADRLGLLVWAETPGAFEFSSTAATRLLAEWTAVIERDLSHPSIVTWVPLNESWGVQHIEHDPAMRAFARALVSITRTLDGSRPVISNDGWEHVDSDIISVHDYESSGAVLTKRYSDDDAKERLLDGFGPAGRRILLDGQQVGERPVMLTEFGGISFATRYVDTDAWGYSSASGADDFVARLRAVVGALDESTFLAGYCYTQLADTLQETNGLVSDDRVPKAPIEVLRAIFSGQGRSA